MNAEDLDEKAAQSGVAAARIESTVAIWNFMVLLSSAKLIEDKDDQSYGRMATSDHQPSSSSSSSTHGGRWSSLDELFAI